MARAKAPNPDAELAELHAKRMALAVRRDAHATAQGAAERVIEGSADRRSAALVSEARGEEPSETAEQVDRERHAAEIAVRDNRERAEALRRVEGEVQEEVEAVIDAHPAFFVAQAVAASEAASEALAAASQATSAAVTAWMGARGAWSVVRMSRRRRRLELGPEIPIHDLGSAVNELSTQQSRTWPGGSREAWERFLARDAAASNAPRFSNREALAQFGGQAA
jgi:hypothetical protein